MVGIRWKTSCQLRQCGRSYYAAPMRVDRPLNFAETGAMPPLLPRFCRRSTVAGAAGREHRFGFGLGSCRHVSDRDRDPTPARQTGSAPRRRDGRRCQRSACCSSWPLAHRIPAGFRLPSAPATPRRHHSALDFAATRRSAAQTPDVRRPTSAAAENRSRSPVALTTA